MKILKYIFLLLLLAGIAITVFIATQEGKYDIKKERLIKVSKPVLYNYINEYKNWENVGILSGNDTTAVYTFSQNTAGRDAFMAWKKNSKEGKVQTTKVVENDSIIQNAVIDNLKSDIHWGFKDTIGVTKVSVRIKGQLTFSEKAYALLNGGITQKYETSLDKSLDNLDNFLVHELNTYSVAVKGLVNKNGVYYLGHFTSTKIADINAKISETMPKLIAFVEDNKIATNGAPFILYQSFDTQADKALFAVCIPIKEEIYTTAGSEFEGKRLLAFTALKTTLKGDYSHLKKAWDKAKKYVADKALQENTTGQYLEVYTRGSKQTKKPSEWITDIYIPIGQPQPDPAVIAASAKPTVTAPVQKPTVAPATLKPASGAATGTATTKPAATNNTTSKPAATRTTPVVKKPAPAPATTKPTTPTQKR